jgi:hypothetical protein
MVTVRVLLKARADSERHPGAASHLPRLTRIRHWPSLDSTSESLPAGIVAHWRHILPPPGTCEALLAHLRGFWGKHLAAASCRSHYDSPRPPRHSRWAAPGGKGGGQISAGGGDVRASHGGAAPSSGTLATFDIERQTFDIGIL